MHPLTKKLSLAVLTLLFLSFFNLSYAGTAAYRGGFVLLSPENGASSVSLTPTLDWSDMPGAVFYDVQVATDVTFAKPVIDVTGILAITSEYTIGKDALEDGTTYYWRVQYSDGVTTSGWLEPFSFSTIINVPSIPVLTAPINNAVDVSVTPSLDWDSVRGAESYSVQIASDIKFGNIVNTVSDIQVSNLDVLEGTLDYSTTYYWRVNATNKAGSSIYSEAFSFSTQIAPPLTPVLSLPLNNSTGIGLTPTLEWNANKGETYQLQLSADDKFTANLIDVSDLSSNKYEIAAKLLNNSSTYYWRVKAVNSTDSSEFSAAFSFTTISAVPDAPVLTSPANNATGQSLTLAFDWEGVKGADTYELQVSADTSFSKNIISETLSETEFETPKGLLSNLTTYYWRVSASNKGGSSEYSSVYTFTTIVAEPTIPVLTSPVNGATGQSLTVILNWEDVENTKGYQVQVSTDSTFTKTVVDESNVTISQYQIQSGALENSTIYFWRVKADNFGGSSEFSAPFSFRTIAEEPLVPELVSPANGSTGQPLALELNWNDVTGASTYNLQLSADSSFTKPIIDVTGLDTSSYSVLEGTLNNLTAYYWRVSSTNKGGSSSFSSTFMFTTIVAEPGVPVLASPLNGATGQSLTALLNWNDVENSKGYQVQVSTDSAFSSTVIDESNVTISQYPVQSGILQNGTWYYWRVKSDNFGGSSEFSSPFSFRTILASPVVPVLISPDNGATAVDTLPLFDWEPVPGAEIYNFHLSSDTAFADTVVLITGIDSTSYQSVTPLNEGTTYYWRVSAENKGGEGEFSEVFSFTTMMPLPQSPVLVSPENGVKGVALNTYFDWNDLEGFDGVYELEVAIDSAFKDLVKSKTELTKSEYLMIDTLDESTTHYWRVRAYNKSGAGPWSEEWSFTTTFLTDAGNTGAIIPKEFSLHQNYPNPFNPTTKIKFDIPQTTRGVQNAQIVIYNLLGQTVATLFQGQVSPGVFELQWDASKMSSGIYFYELRTEDFKSIKRMSLIK